MRTVKVLSILLSVIVLSAAGAYAGPPLDGTWSSTSGAFDEGTASTSYAGGSPLNLGNVIYGQSYAGGVFTGDWSIQCPQVVSVVLLSNTVNGSGNGHRTYLLSYSGGYLTLGGPGNPWNGGDAVYNGLISTYTEVRTVQFANHLVVGATSDHAISALIQGYPDECASWAIGNGVLRGANIPGTFDYGILQSVKPANYPDFRITNCVVQPASAGHWEDIKDLTLTIHGCTVATKQSSWGSVKAMYRK